MLIGVMFMTFSSIFNFVSFLIIGLVCSFVIFQFISMYITSKKKDQYKIHQEANKNKINYLNIELASYDMQILPKDSLDINNGRLQYLSNKSLAGEYSLLPIDLTGGDEVFRFILKDKRLSNGLLEINLDDRIRKSTYVKDKRSLITVQKVHHEFIVLKGNEVSANKHGYLVKNGVQGFSGLTTAVKNLTIKHTTPCNKTELFKVYKGDLLIPAINAAKEFVTYQIVDSSYNTRMRIGVSFKGSFFPIGPYRADREVYILSEDYLSGYTLYRATKISTLVCFDVHNMVDVASSLLEVNRNIEIIFATSRDLLTRNKSRIKRGMYYSNLFNMPFILPKFPDGEPYDYLKTWNELQHYESDEIIKSKVFAQIKFFKDNGKKATIKIACDKYGVEY